jgi:hypothetical protein
MNGQALSISSNNSPAISVNKQDTLAPQKIVGVTVNKPKKAPKKPTKKAPKKLPNDKRTNEQRMNDYQNCVKKNCECHGKKNKWNCCPQCRNTLRKRIPTNKDGIPIWQLTQKYKNKTN